MADLIYTTQQTNFAKSVTDLVVKELVESLSEGLPWTPPGSIRSAHLIPGTNGIARFMTVTDLDTSTLANFDLAEGITPDGQDLEHDYVDVQTSQKGGFVRLTDLAEAESPFGIAGQAAKKITLQAQTVIDAVARAAYAANAASIFGGVKATKALLTATDYVTIDNLINGVALLRRNGVKPLAGGLYVGVASPFVLADISRLDGFVDAVKFAKPELLLKGAVGVFRGIQFTEVLGDRSVVSNGGVGGAIPIYRLQLIGKDALAFGDLTTLEIMSASGVSTSDPLAQRATVGWKARLGAALIVTDEQSAMASVARTVGIEAAVSFGE
jgi:N4-gp56 family major capsid protein